MTDYNSIMEAMDKVLKELGPLPPQRKPWWSFEPLKPEFKDEPFEVSLEAWTYSTPVISNRSNVALYNTPIDPGPPPKTFLYGGIKVYEMSDRLCPTISIQNRWHRKKRINKKWAKRYGFRTIPDPKSLNSVWLVDDGYGGQSAHVYASMVPKLQKALSESLTLAAFESL